MKLEQSFEVQAPIDSVWEALNDLERVAPCLPGAAIERHDEEGVYHGSFQVKLGPTTAAYRGTIRIEDADAASHTATMQARGTDKRGQGGASATIVSHLVEVDGGTRVDVVNDFSITGRLARFGRSGMIQDISTRLMHDFATCLQSRLGAEPEPEEVAAAAGGAAEARPEESALVGKTPAETGLAQPPEPAPPVRGLSLFFSVLWTRIKRLFGRPA
jgi:carbon monoxide dehydrogenase subunit G